MIELRHEQPRGRFAARARLAAARPGGVVFEMPGRVEHSVPMRRFDIRAVRVRRERPQYGDRFRGAESHVPAGRVCASVRLHEKRAGLRIAPRQRCLERRFFDGAIQRKAFGAAAFPASRRLAVARVIVVLAHVAVIAERGAGAFARRDRGDHQRRRMARMRAAAAGESGATEASARVAAGSFACVGAAIVGARSVHGAGSVGGRHFGRRT